MAACLKRFALNLDMDIPEERALREVIEGLGSRRQSIVRNLLIDMLVHRQSPNLILSRLHGAPAAPAEPVGEVAQVLTRVERNPVAPSKPPAEKRAESTAPSFDIVSDNNALPSQEENPYADIFGQQGALAK